jgi:hypothetical protein
MHQVPLLAMVIKHYHCHGTHQTIKVVQFYRTIFTDGGDSYTLLANQASPLSLQDTGLTNGDVYTYQVSAINANGEGALSSPISEYPSTIPLPPANGVFALNSNAGANGNELTLVWDEDPVDVNLNGGSMLTMFRVTDSVGNLLGNINSQVDNPSYSVTIGSSRN